MEEEIKQKIDNAEESDDALTNKVYFTNRSVIKLYRKYPITSFIESVLELPSLKPRYLTRKDRMNNEVKMKKEVQSAGLQAPKILREGEETIEFEKVEGKSGFNYLDSCSENKAKELGIKLREFLDNLHENKSALKDFRLSNLQITDEKIYSLDHEYSSTEAGKWFMFLDELSLVSSARQTENYKVFIDGLDPRKASLFLSAFTSFYHAILFERDKRKIKNLLRSLV